MLNRVLRLTRPLILFDLETSEGNRIVSIAMEVYYPDGRVSAYQSLVNPEAPIPASFSKVHGITDEMIATCCAKCKLDQAHPAHQAHEFKPVPTFKDIAASLYTGFRDADFAGFNILRADLKWIAEEFKLVGITFDYSKASIIDGPRLWQILEPRSLSDFVRHFAGREHTGAHDAMADVVGARDGLVGALTGHPNSDRFPRTPEEIHALCYPVSPNAIDATNKFHFRDDGVPIIDFGQHRGKPMKDVPPSFYWWIANKGKDFSEEVKNIARRAQRGIYPEKKPDEVSDVSTVDGGLQVPADESGTNL